MTDLMMNNTYTLAFPPLYSISNNKKTYQSNQQVNHHLSNHQPINSSSYSSSSSSINFFNPLAPPKYPNYLKLTNYSTLVTEQYNHLQKKKRSRSISNIEYNRDLEEIDFRLPQYWNKNDKSRLIEVGLNGFDVCYSTHATSLAGPSTMENMNDARCYIQKSMEAAIIRTNFPIRPQCGVYYFEVTVVSNGQDGLYAIGFCTINAKLNKLPGYEPNSYGYHGHNGMIFDHQHIEGKEYGPTFTPGDIIGCGIDFSNETAFFTKNGVSLGCAFQYLCSSIEYYPCIGLGSSNEKMTANFGQEPFVFDIAHYIKEQQKKLTTKTIHAQETNHLDELVLAYLTHQGYVETANALRKNIHHVKQVDVAIDTTKSTTDHGRIEIRKAVMCGRIDDAIEQTEAMYPHLLEHHPDLHFKLKARKFLEIMMDEDDASSMHSSRRGSEEEPPVQASGRRLSWAAVAANRSEEEKGRRRMLSFSGRRNSNLFGGEDDKLDVLRKAIEYGQELQDEYQNSPKYLDQLMDMFGLLSFTDPKSSPLAHMLDTGLRDTVASDLNNAIQAYEHHNETSNLESLYKQCIATNKELSLNGHGISSLIPIQNLLSL